MTIFGQRFTDFSLIHVIFVGLLVPEICIILWCLVVTSLHLTLVCAQTWNSALSYFLLGQQPIHHLLKLHPIKVFSKQWCCHWLYLHGTLHLQVMISGKSLFPPSLRFFLPFSPSSSPLLFLLWLWILCFRTPL